MIGFAASIIAGAVMSLQGVFNTQLSDKIGLYESSTFVQGTAFVFSVITMLIFGKGSFSALKEVNLLYLTGGLLGVIITITVMLGISKLNTTTAISVILVSQLICGALIDAFGLFGSEKISFNFRNYIGIALMLSGIIVFKLANR
ncbi:MAG: DMT family transporter [Clostridia bacterium]|nr:DMT family transporter [Clostridia bacterium]